MKPFSSYSKLFPTSLRFLLAIFTLATLSVPALADSPKILLATGHVDEALQTLQQQLDRTPSDAESQNLLCRAYFTLEEWDRAISACDKGTSLDPKKSLYHLWLGRAYGEKADRV